jgi:hypothetical protein
MMFLLVLPAKLGLVRGKSVVTRISQYLTQIRFG